MQRGNMEGKKDNKKKQESEKKEESACARCGMCGGN